MRESLVDAEIIERARQQRDEVQRAAVFEDVDLLDEGAVVLEEVELVAGHGDAVEHVPVLVARPVLDYGALRREGIVVRDAAPVEDGGGVFGAETGLAFRAKLLIQAL
jgi:hypothetical protein